MATFSELKTRAKSDLKKCYWKSILVYLIFMFCMGTLFSNFHSPWNINTSIDKFVDRINTSFNDTSFNDTDFNNGNKYYYDNMNINSSPINSATTDDGFYANNIIEKPVSLLATHKNVVSNSDTDILNPPIDIWGTREKTPQVKKQKTFSHFDISIILAFLVAFFVIIIIVCIVWGLLKIFVLNPLMMGTYKFFLSGTREENLPLSHISYGFDSNYKNIVLVMFLKNLFIGLWTLLFIIPGIIKAFQYSMVPYIMAEDCNLNYIEALSRSKKMMAGHKFNLFLLRLSFILWNILSMFSFGLLNLLYVGPYKSFTEAEFYNALKAQYFTNNPPSLDVPQDL